jgi:hypothetical protein
MRVSTLLWAVLLANPALAHKVELAEDVGAMLHIEPDDVAKAGQPTQLWFALTRQGGEIIPLSACDCQLQIFAKPRSPTDRPLLTPSLQAIEAEGKSNLPSAEVTFPAVGAYQLVLQGAPQAEANFTPFELTFDTVVAAGPKRPATETPTSEATTTAVVKVDPRPQTAFPSWRVGIIAGGAIAAGWGLWWLRRRSGG